jgi:hypothetical protein
MTRTLRTPLVTLAMAVAMMLAFALPATAQPVDQEGLVNVNIGDVTAQVPIGIAANICDIAVNVLAEQVRDGDTVCDATATSDAVFEREDGDDPVFQRGLVNVNAGDITVQVPVAVAANVCDVAVNALATQMRTGEVECDAFAESDATA